MFRWTITDKIDENGWQTLFFCGFSDQLSQISIARPPDLLLLLTHFFISILKFHLSTHCLKIHFISGHFVSCFYILQQINTKNCGFFYNSFWDFFAIKIEYIYRVSQRKHLNRFLASKGSNINRFSNFLSLSVRRRHQLSFGTNFIKLRHILLSHSEQHY